MSQLSWTAFATHCFSDFHPKTECCNCDILYQILKKLFDFLNAAVTWSFLFPGFPIPNHTNSDVEGEGKNELIGIQRNFLGKLLLWWFCSLVLSLGFRRKLLHEWILLAERMMTSCVWGFWACRLWLYELLVCLTCIYEIHQVLIEVCIFLYH